MVSKTYLLELQFGVRALCVPACVVPMSVRIFAWSYFVHLCMNFKSVWHSCSFETFVQVS